jgi:hypothetical protein
MGHEKYIKNLVANCCLKALLTRDRFRLKEIVNFILREAGMNVWTAFY